MKRAVLDGSNKVVGFVAGHAEGPIVPDDIPVAMGWVWVGGEDFEPPQHDALALASSTYSVRTDDINRACESAITAGFLSAALGHPHHYSSQLDDQLNLTGAILRGLDMPYACRDEQGAKAYRLHTAAQLRQVGDDFTLYKLQLLQRANELKQQLDLALAAGDAEAMQAITWEGAES